MMGCLPSGVQAGVPWRQLCFNPNPLPPVGGGTHIGLGTNTTAGSDGTPPDHLLLDLFWMPVVEPYAISEPLSTAGKINMNYQIEPFTYINRQTALYAAMKSDKIYAVPYQALNVSKCADQNCGAYPASWGSPQVANQWSFHYPINIYQTLWQFNARFNGNDGYFPGGVGVGGLFVSASQICSIFLEPMADPVYVTQNPPHTPAASAFALPAADSLGSTTNIAAWWGAGGLSHTTLSAGASTLLTGANGRQQPYAHLYSLLTTKSNTFKVHMRVQVLAKNNSSIAGASVFDTADGDAVVGEYRGSATIERYVDPNDTNLPDFATSFTTAGSNTLDQYYHFRIVNTKAFTPQ
jgi:uncharacterized protein (TIGR02600 family)